MKKTTNKGTAPKCAVEKATNEYERIISDLSSIGAAGFPQPNQNNKWNSLEDLYQALKIVELLSVRRRQLDIDAAIIKEKKIDPLLSKTKQNQTFLDEVKANSAALSQEIEKYKEKLVMTKNKRLEQNREQQQEIDAIDQKIFELSDGKQTKDLTTKPLFQTRGMERSIKNGKRM